MSPTTLTFAQAALAVAVAAGLAAASACEISPPVAVQPILLASLAATVGTTHGGLDHRFGRVLLRPRLGVSWPLAFASIYLIIAASTLVGWSLAPLTTILVFFLASSVHFGEGVPGPMSAVEGGMVIWIPMLARPEEVTRLLGWVTPGNPGDSIVAAVTLARPLLWALALVLAVRIARLAGSERLGGTPAGFLEAARLSTFAAVFATAPVLLSFTAFFCGWHSTRELARLAGRADPARPLRGLSIVLRSSAPMTALAVFATALLAWWWSGGRPGDPVVVQAVFLGLSAVAIPHIVLHAIARRLDADPFATEVAP